MKNIYDILSYNGVYHLVVAADSEQEALTIREQSRVSGPIKSIHKIGTLDDGIGPEILGPENEGVIGERMEC